EPAGVVRTTAHGVVRGNCQVAQLLQDLLLHVGADLLEVGDLQRDLLDLLLAQQAQQLDAVLLAERDHKDGNLLLAVQLGNRNLCFRSHQSSMIQVRISATTSSGLCSIMRAISSRMRSCLLLSRSSSLRRT